MVLAPRPSRSEKATRKKERNNLKMKEQSVAPKHVPKKMKTSMSLKKQRFLPT